MYSPLPAYYGRSYIVAAYRAFGYCSPPSYFYHIVQSKKCKLRSRSNINGHNMRKKLSLPFMLWPSITLLPFLSLPTITLPVDTSLDTASCLSVFYTKTGSRNEITPVKFPKPEHPSPHYKFISIKYKCKAARRADPILPIVVPTNCKLCSAWGLASGRLLL